MKRKRSTKKLSVSLILACWLYWKGVRSCPGLCWAKLKAIQVVSLHSHLYPSLTLLVDPVFDRLFYHQTKVIKTLPIVVLSAFFGHSVLFPFLLCRTLPHTNRLINLCILDFLPRTLSLSLRTSAEINFNPTLRHCVGTIKSGGVRDTRKWLMRIWKLPLIFNYANCVFVCSGESAHVERRNYERVHLILIRFEFSIGFNDGNML